MGIPGLLPQLQQITSQCHISELRDKTCGIDASCILYRSAFTCSMELLLNPQCTKFTPFIFKYLNELQKWNITPIMVFDGDQLPMKMNEEKKRSESREQNKQIALNAYKSNDPTTANKYAAKSIKRTPAMSTELIKQLKKQKIQFIVAPYEADAQLGLLYKQNLIDFVISEDSDLILYGVRQCLYKFDITTCIGQLVDMDKAKMYYPLEPNINKPTDICTFLRNSENHMRFVEICVFSGCDYLASIKGIGLKTSIKLFTKYGKIEDILSHLRKTKSVPFDYQTNFKKACLVFSCQTVYDTISQSLRHLNEPFQHSTSVVFHDLNFVGPLFDNHTAQLIAEGIIDSRSRKPTKLSPITFPDSTIMSCLQMGFSVLQIALVLDEVEKATHKYREKIKYDDEQLNLNTFNDILYGLQQPNNGNKISEETNSDDDLC